MRSRPRLPHFFVKIFTNPWPAWNLSSGVGYIKAIITCAMNYVALLANRGRECSILRLWLTKRTVQTETCDKLFWELLFQLASSIGMFIMLRKLLQWLKQENNSIGRIDFSWKTSSSISCYTSVLHVHIFPMKQETSLHTWRVVNMIKFSCSLPLKR